MRFPSVYICVFACLAALMLSSCAGPNMGERIPQWMDGEPEGLPPRRGTPEYHA
jgi:hypothetical protein